MYDFYYNCLEPHWQIKVHLHYMDTDRFNTNQKCSTFTTKQTEFIQQNKNEFNLSELDKSHEIYDPNNEKVLGKIVVTADVVTASTVTKTKTGTKVFAATPSNQVTTETKPRSETRCVAAKKVTRSGVVLFSAEKYQQSERS